MTRKDAQIELGAGIRHFRRRRKLTMECLCEQAGVSRTTLHHLERGDRPARAHTVTAILSVLDLAPDDLRMVLGYLPDDVRERTLVVLRALPDRRPQDASCAEALYDYDVHLVSSGMVPMGELVPVLRSKGIDVRWEEDSSITFRLPGRQLVDVTTWLRALEARFVWDDVPAADPSPVRHNY